MVKFLAFVCLSAGMALGQAKVYNASNYSTWNSYVYSGNAATGASSIVANPVVVNAASGQQFIPFVANEVITIDKGFASAETITVVPTNCYVGSLKCTLSGTFAFKHAAGSVIISGTFGLQDAINQALLSPASGTVVLDSTWVGPAGISLISAAVGSVNVVVQDNRSGSPVNYQWGGSSYIQSGSGSSSSYAFLPASPNVVYSFVASSDQGTSTTVADISGSGNTATFGGTAPQWTGTGLNFANSVSSVVNLPASLNGDQTFCAGVYLPFVTGTAIPSGPAFDYILAGTAVASTGFGWIASQGAGSYTYQPYTFANVAFKTKAKETEAGYHTLCVVQGLVGNSTTDRLWFDGVEDTYFQTGASGLSQTTTNLVFGANSSAYSNLTYYYFAGWAGQLTPTQVVQASNAITASVAARGVQTTPTFPLFTASGPFLIEVAGDSIAGGFDSTNPWPNNLTLTTAPTIVNNGEFGATSVATLSAARWRDAPSCYTNNAKDIVIIAVGVNDLPLLSLTAAQTFGYISSAVNILQRAGCIVAVATMTSNTSAAGDTYKDALNPMIRAGGKQGLYSVIDLAASPNVGADNAWTNGTYFFTDHLHIINAGQTLLAAAASNAINSILGSTSANPTIYSSNAVTMLSGDNVTKIIPTAAATASLPDCLGVTGYQYSIFNASAGAFTITFSGVNGETITGSATLAQNLNAVFQAQLISQAAAGCNWLRVQ